MSLAIVGTLPSYTVALCIEKAWTVCLECADCERPATRWTDREMTRLPGGATLQQIADRAACGTCGLRRGRVVSQFEI